MGNKPNDNGINYKCPFSFDIGTPEIAQSSFDPELVIKGKAILVNNFYKKIIGLYRLKISYQDIFGHIQKMCDTDISHTGLRQTTY
ncbi:hypothetical protein [Salegentibacter sp. 24]|uniref:hypothetical protein n=1 Tax=Salegentibacter sp. 24 TaxID=2183986 RepID=UPI0010610633|nr:hypothetical protein [Salegentibacter sp. 24]